MQGEERSQFRFGDVQVAFKDRHRDAEILAHEVERRIPHDGRHQDAPLPLAVFQFDQGRILHPHRQGRRRLEKAQERRKSSRSLRRGGTFGHCVAVGAGLGSAAPMGQRPCEPKISSRQSSSKPVRMATSSTVKRRRMQNAWR